MRWTMLKVCPVSAYENSEVISGQTLRQCRRLSKNQVSAFRVPADEEEFVAFREDIDPSGYPLLPGGLLLRFNPLVDLGNWKFKDQFPVAQLSRRKTTSLMV